MIILAKFLVKLDFADANSLCVESASNLAYTNNNVTYSNEEKAAYFTTNSFLRQSNNIGSIPYSGHVVTWLQRLKLMNSHTNYLVFEGYPSNVNPKQFSIRSSDGTLGIDTRNKLFNYIKPSKPFSLNKWHLFKCVYNDQTKIAKIYIDHEYVGDSMDTSGTTGHVSVGYVNSLAGSTNNAIRYIDYLYIIEGEYGLNLQIPSTRFDTYDRSPNGLKYKIRVRFEYGDWTETSNVVNYETTRILSVLRKILIINILYKYMRSLNF